MIHAVTHATHAHVQYVVQNLAAIHAQNLAVLHHATAVRCQITVAINLGIIAILPLIG